MREFRTIRHLNAAAVKACHMGSKVISSTGPSAVGSVCGNCSYWADKETTHEVSLFCDCPICVAACGWDECIEIKDNGAFTISHEGIGILPTGIDPDQTTFLFPENTNPSEDIDMQPTMHAALIAYFVKHGYEFDATLEITVCRSGAGYYIGQMLDDSPWSRLSAEYFGTHEEAELALFAFNFTPKLTP